MKSLCLKCVFFILTVTDIVSCLQKDYLNMVCNTGVYVGNSRRLESSTALYYEANTDCYYTVTVDAGKRVLVHVRLFDLEDKVMNACVDYVNIHDGSSTGSASLNSAPLCREAAADNYTSTGNQLTVYFKTDSTGARHGFDFIIVAITTAPCSSGQFACNNNVCIDESLHCNRYDECGDNTDEAGCDYTHLTGTQPDDNAPLIIGFSIGIPVLIVCSLLIGYWCWRYNRWRLFMKRPLTAPEVSHDSSTFAGTYPVTHIYYKERYQSLYLNNEPLPSGYVNSSFTMTEQDTTSTRKQDVSVAGSDSGTSDSNSRTK